MPGPKAKPNRTSRAERELKDIDDVFRALSHATRRHILVVIAARGGQMTAGRIAERFSHRWPTITRHLKVLEDARLLRVEQRGRERHYVIARERLHRVGRGWFDYFRDEEDT